MADDTPIHESATEASAGTGPGAMRYVLFGSLLLVVIVFAAIVAIGWM